MDYSDVLTEGDIKEEMYKHTETFSQAMLGALKEGTQGAYLGLLDTEPEFFITLQGLSETDLMDIKQSKYFSEQIVSFFNNKIATRWLPFSSI